MLNQFKSHHFRSEQSVATFSYSEAHSINVKMKIPMKVKGFIFASGLSWGVRYMRPIPSIGLVVRYKRPIPSMGFWNSHKYCILEKHFIEIFDIILQFFKIFGSVFFISYIQGQSCDTILITLPIYVGHLLMQLVLLCEASTLITGMNNAFPAGTLQVLVNSSPSPPTG